MQYAQRTAIGDEGLLDVTERRTAVPDYDVSAFARAATSSVDDERTLDIPLAKLQALVSESRPPAACGSADADAAAPFAAVRLTEKSLASHALSAAALRLIAGIDGETPLSVVILGSGLPHDDAMGALRELYQGNVIDNQWMSSR